MSASVIMALFILQNFIVETRTEAENDDGEYLDQYEREMRTRAPADANLEIEMDDSDDSSDEENDELTANGRLEKQISDFSRMNDLRM